jgi:hypothetical protein
VLGGDRVEAEALRRGVPDRRALEEVEGLGGPDQGLDAGGRQDLDCLGHRANPAAGLGALVRQAHDRDHERDVGLDRVDHLGDGRLLLAHEPEHALARLGQRRERLERLESRRQPATVTFILLLGSGQRGRGRLTVNCGPRIALPRHALPCGGRHRQLTYRQEGARS